MKTQRKAISLKLEGASSTLHIDCNYQYDMVAVGGRSVFKIFYIHDDSDPSGASFVESVNMRGVKAVNLNYSCNDVVWSHLDPVMLATAATNGAIVIWNLTKASKHRQLHVFVEHSRMVNKVSFHPTDPNVLISGSQDGTVRLFDIRAEDPLARMTVSKESVRDVQWNPHSVNQLAAVSENGQVQLWDIRRPDTAENTWSAHADHIYSCDWHPEMRKTLATAGRDKTIKVWDVESRKPVVNHVIHAIDAVAKIKWRPTRRFQIASISQISDYSVQVWDVRRPYVPFGTFNEHTAIPTSFLWRGDPHTLLSVAKDNFLYQHTFNDVKRPYDNANPFGISFNSEGDLLYSFRDGNSQDVVPKYHGDSKVVRKSPQKPVSPTKIANMTKQELFRANVSQLLEIQSCFQGQDADSPQTDDEFHYLTDQRYIKYMAQHLKFDGMPFTQLCEHNSKVSAYCGRNMLARTWMIVRQMYLTDEEFMAEVAGDDVDKVETMSAKTEFGSEVVADDPNNFAAAPEKKSPQNEESNAGARSRVTSSSSKKPRHRKESSTTGIRDRSGSIETSKTGGTMMSRRRSKSGRSATKKPADAASSDENTEAEDEQDDDNDQTLTNIANGQNLMSDFAVDFFGDNESAYYFGFNSMVVPENDYTKPEPDFNNLPTEAFEYRREFNEEANDELEWEHAQTSGLQNTSGNQASEEPTVLQTCVSVVNNAMNTLTINTDLLEAEDNFNPDIVFKETLDQYAGLNDTQTVVAMYLVVSSRLRNRKLIDTATLDQLFNAYINLLQRYKLYDEAIQIMALCNLDSIQSVSARSTYLRFNCGGCGKPVSKPGLRSCKSRPCQTIPNMCSVCHELVNGIYVWCQGCGHGGHVEHIESWLKQSQTCAGGCGHICEYL